MSRVTVGDFDECKSTEHNDCADNAICYNIEGSYTCACQDGFHDLSGPDSLPGRVCSGKNKIVLLLQHCKLFMIYMYYIYIFLDNVEKLLIYLFLGFF